MATGGHLLHLDGGRCQEREHIGHFVVEDMEFRGESTSLECLQDLLVCLNVMAFFPIEHGLGEIIITVVIIGDHDVLVAADGRDEKTSSWIGIKTACGFDAGQVHCMGALLDGWWRAAIF
jgi:hypothetical protein